MILIIQNGYSCDYEMRLFASMFFGEDEDVTITQNFNYSDKNINVYTHIIFDGKSYFEDYNFKFDTDGKTEKLIKKIFIASLINILNNMNNKYGIIILIDVSLSILNLL